MIVPRAAGKRASLQSDAAALRLGAGVAVAQRCGSDWETADRLEPQLDEPWRKPSARNPDMLLTAENGWMGDMAHGPDKKAELRKAMNDYLIELGQPPIDWAKEEG